MQRLSSLHSPAQLCLDAMKGLQSVLDNSNISHVPKSRLVWKKEPEEEDFEGALAFLSLGVSKAKAAKLISKLRRTKSIEYAAKDLLRASGLPLLPREEPHVDDDLKKINKGKPLPPVLLVRGEISRGIPLIVADGYHRICAICYFDESAPVPCRITDGWAD